uniref:BZIP domain-containing protein n=1 Tax=Mus spicilegus TaxID=10103 RepID=A0A8C6IDU1_MUSSI
GSRCPHSADGLCRGPCPLAPPVQVPPRPEEIWGAKGGCEGTVKPLTGASHPNFPGAAGGPSTAALCQHPVSTHSGSSPWVGFVLPRDFHEGRGPLAESSDLGGILDPESPKDDDRKVRRREKNRVAAQRSRKKQTQKADKLHEEHESLEQENSVLRREIAKLKEELRHLSEALKEHEKMCPLLLCPMNFVQLRSDPVASCLPR